MVGCVMSPPGVPRAAPRPGAPGCYTTLPLAENTIAEGVETGYPVRVAAPTTARSTSARASASASGEVSIRSWPPGIGTVGHPAASAICRNGRTEGAATTAVVGMRSTAPLSAVASVKHASG